MRLLTPRRIRRLILLLALLIVIPPIIGWLSRGYIEKSTAELAGQIDAHYTIESESRWFNSLVRTEFEFSPSVIKLEGESIAEELLGAEPLLLTITHEVFHGPVLFSTKPFEWLKPYFGIMLINSAIVVENSANSRLKEILGDYVIAKTTFVGLTELSTRIKPGRKQFSIDNIAPVSILSPELVIERSIFDSKYDAFLSINKAQIHSTELASPIFENVSVRMKPLSREITPDAESNVIITAEQIRTERITLKNVRINSLMQPLSETTAAVSWSINIASVNSDMVAVAHSVGANIAVSGLTKDSIRPVTKRVDSHSLNQLVDSSIKRPFNIKGYLAANTSAGPMNLSVNLTNHPGSTGRTDTTLMRLMEQISGDAQLDISDDAFLLGQLALQRIKLNDGENEDIQHHNGKSHIAINIQNGVAQIGNLYFDLPSLTLL